MDRPLGQRRFGADRLCRGGHAVGDRSCFLHVRRPHRGIHQLCLHWSGQRDVVLLPGASAQRGRPWRLLRGVERRGARRATACTYCGGSHVRQRSGRRLLVGSVDQRRNHHRLHRDLEPGRVLLHGGGDLVHRHRSHQRHQLLLRCHREQWGRNRGNLGGLKHRGAGDGAVPSSSTVWCHRRSRLGHGGICRAGQ